MAKGHSSSIKRKNALYLEFDTYKWLEQFDKKVEDFNGKGGAFERAVARIVKVVNQDITTFMNEHNVTGATMESLTPAPILTWGDDSYFKQLGKKKKKVNSSDANKNILFVEFGFQIDKGGLPSIFLDVGRPGIKYKNGYVGKPQQPHFVLYYVVERNMATFNKYFKEEVMKELEGLR